jgi:hypothetical protein
MPITCRRFIFDGDQNQVLEFCTRADRTDWVGPLPVVNPI